MLAATLIACSGGKDDGTGEDTDAPDTNGTDSCANGVSLFQPLQGATDAYILGDIRFTLDIENSGATVSLADAAGAAVPGNTNIDGLVVTFTPSSALTPTTQYVATLTYDCGDLPLTFTTSATGTPVSGDLTGNVYDLDLSSANVYIPADPTVSSLLLSLIPPELNLFFKVTGVDEGANQINMIGGIGSNNIQDECTPTLPIPTAAYDNPSFVLQAPLLPIGVGDFTINIADFTLAGSFSPDGGAIEGAQLVGLVDTRGLAGSISLITATGDDAVCDLIAEFELDVPCVPCADGQPYCIDIAMDGINAVKSNATFEEITPAQVLDNPSCPTN